MESVLEFLWTCGYSPISRNLSHSIFNCPGIVFDFIQAHGYLVEAPQLRRDVATSTRFDYQHSWVGDDPTRCLHFRGALFDNKVGKMFIPPDRWMKIQMQVLLSEQSLTHLQWQELLGLISSAQALTERELWWKVCFFLWPFLQRDDCKTRIRLPMPLNQHFQLWLWELNVCGCNARLGSAPIGTTDSRALVRTRTKSAHQQGKWCQQ